MDLSIHERIKHRIATAPKDPNVSKSEIIRAIYAIAIHKFGKEAVGDLYKYLPRSASYWTLERCMESASKYKNRFQWKKNERGAHCAAMSNGWYLECVKHMPDRAAKPTGHWDLKRCRADAALYKSRSEWKRQSSSAYSSAQKNNWLEDCCSYIGKNLKYSRNWSKEDCIQSASRFLTRGMWQKNEPAAYRSAFNGGFLDECCAHMELKRRPANYWTKDMCMAEAARFQSRGEWKKAATAAYRKSLKEGWHDECCAHMKPR